MFLNNALLIISEHFFLLLQDRMERAARYAKTQEEEMAARQALLQARQAEQEVKKEATVRERR